MKNKKIILLIGLAIAGYIMFSKQKDSTETSESKYGKDVIYLETKTPFEAVINFLGEKIKLPANKEIVAQDGGAILTYENGKVFLRLPFDENSKMEIPFRKVFNIKS